MELIFQVCETNNTILHEILFQIPILVILKQLENILIAFRFLL